MKICADSERHTEISRRVYWKFAIFRSNIAFPLASAFEEPPVRNAPDISTRISQ